ncbi:MAG: hypothetical protein HOV81_10905 [Kofleriaceae bacterium]|nr:hypothetical protein [Kofleriaceae bacterium]
MRTAERERQPGTTGVHEEAPIAHSMPPSTTQFRDGAIPPVGGEFQSPGPSASERAYADDPMMPKELLDIVAKGDVSDLAQMLQAYPTLRQAILGAITRTHGAHTAQTVGQQTKKAPPQQAPVAETKPAKALPEGYDDGPIRIDEDHASDRSKMAAFDQIAVSHTPEASAPSHIRLPPTLVRTLDQLWAETQATNKEQGGNLVRTYGGKYEFKRTHSSEDNEDSYEPDTKNVGRLDSHVGIVHTHPLDDKRPDGVTFGAVDIVGLVDEDQPLNILRSGINTYVISRTKEFDALVEKTNNDPEKLSELRMSMHTTYTAAFQAEKDAGGGPASCVEKGLIAMCRKFHLIYYWGQGQDLHRIR